MNLKKIFRNPASDILLVLGLVISCVILINMAELVSKITTEEKITEPFKYSKCFGLGNCDETEVLKQYVHQTDIASSGNTYLSVLVYIQRQEDETNAYMVMENNEELMLEYREGGFEKNMDCTNGIIIGENLEKYVTEEDGKKYLYINDFKHYVIGILENKMSGGIDNSLYILWDTLETEIKEYYLSDPYMFNLLYIKSNNIDLRLYDTISEKMAKYGAVLVEYDQDYTGNYQNYWYRFYNNILLSVGFIFSVFTCFSVSYLWLLNRKKELNIRIAYGYSDFQIFKLLLRDILLLMFWALLLSMIIQLLYSLILGEMTMFGEHFIMRILIIFVGMFVVVLLNAIYLMEKIRKNNICVYKY